MPVVGLGLHVLIAVFFAVHAVRSGQNMYWLIILFSFPLIGSIVYALAVYLPDSRIERGARQAMRAAARAMDPGKELREAQDAFAYTPTAQNQMRLAAAYLEAGQALQAAENYEACLKGPFATDPQIRLGAARAYAVCGDHASVVTHTTALAEQQPDFRPEEVAVLRANALTGLGKKSEAQAELEAALARHGGFDLHAEYFLWAVRAGETAVANRLSAELGQMTRRWSRHTRALNREMLQRLEEAQMVLDRRG